MKTILEISSQTHPQSWWVIGDVQIVPAVGDFIQDTARPGLTGYVQSRRFEYDGDECTVRVWTHKEPPRR